MIDIMDFLRYIGFAEWGERYLVNRGVDLTFGDLVFDTLPYMLRLFFIVFLLNWIMGIISDTCRLRIGGSRL